jgi:hypothetical protein
VIDVLWREDPDVFRETLRHNFRRKPTNAAFLSAAADRVHLGSCL